MEATMAKICHHLALKTVHHHLAGKSDSFKRARIKREIMVTITASCTGLGRCKAAREENSQKITPGKPESIPATCQRTSGH